MDAIGMRRRMAMVGGLAVLGLPLAAQAAPKERPTSAPEEPRLQVTYSTDPYLTCDSLRDEMFRMDVIAKGAQSTVAGTAMKRKAGLAAILKTKSCGPAKAMNFGPGMYD